MCTQSWPTCYYHSFSVMKKNRSSWPSKWQILDKLREKKSVYQYTCNWSELISVMISGQNANVKTLTPKTPIQVSGITYIGSLSVAFRPDTTSYSINLQSSVKHSSCSPRVLYFYSMKDYNEKVHILQCTLESAEIRFNAVAFLLTHSPDQPIWYQIEGVFLPVFIAACLWSPTHKNFRTQINWGNHFL